MKKVLKFKVSIEGLEDKIYRIIEINDAKTIADLAYSILTSFNSLAYHLYKIEYHDNIYYCSDEFEELEDLKNYKIASKEKLYKIDFNKNDTMIMKYDFGSPTTFIIKYLSTDDLTIAPSKYPRIIDGKGNGMLDDISSNELLEIVKNTDKLGSSTYYYTPGYELDKIYDYRDYNYDELVKEFFANYLMIKYGYEEDEY